MIKVFISHQQMDTAIASRISSRLRHIHSIDTYLDVIDPGIRNGEDLASHIQAEMSKCTQLLAVVSDKTRESWWVPWEIGVATEKDYPLATYLFEVTNVPEYLRKWPYLGSDGDIDKYAFASKNANVNFMNRRATLTEAAARSTSTQDFFSALRRNLGQ